MHHELGKVPPRVVKGEPQVFRERESPVHSSQMRGGSPVSRKASNASAAGPMLVNVPSPLPMAESTARALRLDRELGSQGTLG